MRVEQREIKWEALFATVFEQVEPAFLVDISAPLFGKSASALNQRDSYTLIPRKVTMESATQPTGNRPTRMLPTFKTQRATSVGSLAIREGIYPRTDLSKSAAES